MLTIIIRSMVCVCVCVFMLDLIPNILACTVWFTVYLTID